jgi:hypothetical protein
MEIPAMPKKSEEGSMGGDEGNWYLRGSEDGAMGWTRQIWVSIESRKE